MSDGKFESHIDRSVPTCIAGIRYLVAECSPDAIDATGRRFGKITEAVDDYNERMRREDVRVATLVMIVRHCEHRSFANTHTKLLEIVDTTYDVHHVLAHYRAEFGESDEQQAYARRARAGYGEKNNVPRLAEHYTIDEWRSIDRRKRARDE